VKTKELEYVWHGAKYVQTEKKLEKRIKASEKKTSILVQVSFFLVLTRTHAE